MYVNLISFNFPEVVGEGDLDPRRLYILSTIIRILQVPDTWISCQLTIICRVFFLNLYIYS